ncbi:FlgO family outer membrane protein [Desulfovibrio cuneatus]|uniref:FlgO family outer membrane protein n=1 Tax=Desulfovibrio cuneatus TaxID=159728 RepID=UPI00041B6698|nr:FlgO family outer membrane protein [Desulfovibrio cuneatus]
MFAKHPLSLLSLMLFAGACFFPPAGAAGGTNPPPMPESMRFASQQPTIALDGSAPIRGKSAPAMNIQGRMVPVTEATEVDSGIVLPDRNGGIVIIPGSPRQAPNPNHANARELKLQVREMVEQLISGINSNALRGAIALPVSFVNQDNMESSSSFGRYIAEQMFYEFNQRGFPIREYRIGCDISMREGEGDFFLTRAQGERTVPAGSVVVAGTYYADSQNIFVNARLIRPGDGRVLRTANMVLPANSLTRRMLARTGKTLEKGSLKVRDFQETISPQAVNAIDQGQDIH